MNLTPEQVIKRPIAMTEKAARLRARAIEEERNIQVVFEVDLHANKLEIRDAVEALYKEQGIKVAGVNTLVQRGKRKRKGRRVAKGRSWKKAIVTLAEGSDIQFFQEGEEASHGNS